MTGNIASAPGSRHPAPQQPNCRSAIGYNWLIRAERAALVPQPEIGQYRLTGDRRLALGHERPRDLGQIDIEPRAEADQPKAFARADQLAFLHETHDPARHESGDLDHADTPVRRGDHQRIALVILARLIELGIDEGARPVGDVLDLAGRGRAVDVTVEHAHEDRDPRQRLV